MRSEVVGKRGFASKDCEADLIGIFANSQRIGFGQGSQRVEVQVDRRVSGFRQRACGAVRRCAACELVQPPLLGLRAGAQSAIERGPSRHLRGPDPTLLGNNEGYWRFQCPATTYCWYYDASSGRLVQTFVADWKQALTVEVFDRGVHVRGRDGYTNSWIDDFDQVIPIV